MNYIMKKIIVANWKMSPPTVKEAEGLFDGIQTSMPKLKDTEVVICPSFVHLDSLSKMLHASCFKFQVKLGAQDFFWEKKGFYTGEISIPMLKNFGVKYVIVGHSERREYLKANNEIINKKIKSALKSGLKVIFCVGEKERDEGGDYLKFIKQEILEGLSKLNRKDLDNLIIAYEPIWAISSNKNSLADDPQSFFQTSIYIRRVLFFKFGLKVSRQMPILYGGSVDAGNACSFIEEGNAQGLLVGRASLKPKTFTDLLKAI